MDTYTVTAPANWANLFINGDDSGMDADELWAANQFLYSLDGQIVGCSEEDFFVKHHDAYSYYPYAAECVEYTVIGEEA